MRKHMPHKNFYRRYRYKWRFGAQQESEDVFDIPWTWRNDVVWEIDMAGRYHFNMPRVIIEYSLSRWRVGQEDWSPTLDFGLNILAAFVDDDSAWRLHLRFCQEFLVDTDMYNVEHGVWRIK